MRNIEIDIDVFAAIWAQRLSGEDTESQILSRILKEFLEYSGSEKKLSPYDSRRNFLEEDSHLTEEISRVHEEVKGSKKTQGAANNEGETSMGKIRWVDDVRAALYTLGGHASLHAIYREVESRRRKGNRSVPRTLEATIRRTLEDHSSDSANFRSADLFARIGRGEWAIRASL